MFHGAGWHDLPDGTGFHLFFLFMYYLAWLSIIGSLAVGVYSRDQRGESTSLNTPEAGLRGKESQSSVEVV